MPGLFDFLEGKGHVVDVAGISFMARNLAMSNHYDAILLNAGLDELALCQSLRAGAWVTTPILMLSARVTLDDKIACLEAGADDFLVKPVPLQEIESRLRVLFRLRNRLRGRVGLASNVTG